MNVAQGGRIDAGVLHVGTSLQLGGGTLELHAHADPVYTLLPAEVRKSPFGEPLAFASDTMDQAAGSRIVTASGSTLTLQAERGGSVALTQDANQFAGGLNVLSGAQWNTAWASNPRDVGNVRVAAQSQIAISAGTLLVGDKGIEGDVVVLRADRLGMATGTGLIAARLPYNNQLGTAASTPGLTLVLADAAFAQPYSFGGPRGGELRVSIGGRDIGARTTGPDAGFLQVQPKGGSQGATAVYLVGPRVVDGYNFFHDGAAKK